jgi:hypothetical protein
MNRARIALFLHFDLLTWETGRHCRRLSPPRRRLPRARVRGGGTTKAAGAIATPAACCSLPTRAPPMAAGVGAGKPNSRPNSPMPVALPSRWPTIPRARPSQSLEISEKSRCSMAFQGTASSATSSKRRRRMSLREDRSSTAFIPSPVDYRRYTTPARNRPWLNVVLVPVSCTAR